jgi:hypothetical protein
MSIGFRPFSLLVIALLQLSAEVNFRPHDSRPYDVRSENHVQIPMRDGMDSPWAGRLGPGGHSTAGISLPISRNNAVYNTDAVAQMAVPAPLSGCCFEQTDQTLVTAAASSELVVALCRAARRRS